MAVSGRAHGENEDAGNYIMDPLPVPDKPESTSLVTKVPAEPAEGVADNDQNKTESTVCTSCGAQNPPINKFCGSCGKRLPDPPEKSEPEKPPSISIPPDSIYSLICINEDGTDGPKIPLVSDKTIIGRSTDPRFKSDTPSRPQFASHTCTAGSYLI